MKKNKTRRTRAIEAVKIAKAVFVLRGQDRLASELAIAEQILCRQPRKPSRGGR